MRFNFYFFFKVIDTARVHTAVTTQQQQSAETAAAAPAPQLAPHTSHVAHLVLLQ